MKVPTPAMNVKLAEGVLALAMVMVITRRDGQITRLTDYDREIVFGGNTYTPSAGLKRTAISISEGLSVDNMDVSGYYDSNLTQDALRKGRFDGASVHVSFVEASGPDIYGAIEMFFGFIGDIMTDRDKFSLPVHGFTELLQQSFNELTSPDCRANFGDDRCKISLVAHTYTGAISSIADSMTYGITVSQPAERFTYGTVEFTSGLNTGAIIEIKSSPTGSIVLFLPPQYVVALGDTITLVAGCNKMRATCSGTYFNIINMRAEPDLPGVTPMAEPASRLL